jgi:DNA-binding response OmpR family regulator
MADRTLATESSQAPILVVDDDPRMRQTIQWALEDQGFVVELASDGRDAVERATVRRPSLVVLDMGLPLLDGVGVARALRAVHGRHTPPILTISADSRADQKAQWAGAFAYLSKPFELDDLLAAVQRGMLLAPEP